MLAGVDVDTRSLREPVSAALGGAAEVVTFQAKRIGYHNTNPVTASLARLTGSARVGGALRTWSMVLKELRPLGKDDRTRWFGTGLPPALEERANDLYRWDREALAYASPLVGPQSALASPRCYRCAVEQDRALLFLEDLGEAAPVWTLADYAIAAADLGRFNAIHASAPPQDEWLCRGWLSTWVALGPYRGFVECPTEEEWDDERVRRRLPRAALGELKALVGDAARRAAACDALPATLVHMDAFRSNLFLRRTDRGAATVAVDWSFMGLACLGADLAQLVVASAFFTDDAPDVEAIEMATFPAYVDGLRAGGSDASVATIWRAYADNVIARWGFARPLTYALRTARDPAARLAWEERTGEDIERRVRLHVERLAYVRDVASRSAPR